MFFLVCKNESVFRLFQKCLGLGGGDKLPPIFTISCRCICVIYSNFFLDCFNVNAMSINFILELGISIKNNIYIITFSFNINK